MYIYSCYGVNNMEQKKYYVIDKSLSLICEKQTVGIYDLNLNRFIDIISVKDQKIFKLFEALNYPCSMDNLPGLKDFINSPLYQKRWKRYFSVFTKKEYDQIKPYFDKIYDFNQRFKKAFELKDGGLFCLIKRAFLFTKIYVLGKKIDFTKKGLETNYIDIQEIKTKFNSDLDEKNFKHEIYIIFPENCSKKELEELEQIFSINKVTRLYVSETSDFIKIGPCLIGNDYGCYFCNDVFEEHQEEDTYITNPSDLLMALLSEEIPKLYPILLESAIDDYTLSKGKIFKLNKFDLSAEEVEYIININCNIHKRAFNKVNKYKDRWKELKPEETVKKIKKYISGLGLDIIERNKTNSYGCYAILLNIKDTDLFVNGKGGSQALALASAYGELMERISTRALFRFHLQENAERSNQKQSKYWFYPDEKFMDKEEYDKNIGFKNISFEKALGVQQNYLVKSKVVMEPMQSLTGETACFPVSVVDTIYGTNGMSYGNTLNEAKVQAMCEIFERWVNKQVIIKKYTLPQIPISWLESDLRTRIEDINQEGKLNIRVLDASLGLGLPVVAIILEDKSGKYFVKFGSHFDLSVAVERCLTEVFQGRTKENLAFLKEKVYVENDYWKKKNIEKIMHTGDGFYPLNLFKVSKSAPNPWMPIWSNKDAINYYENKLQMLSKQVFFKIYKKDCGYVVRYLLPNVSTICENESDPIIWQIEYGKTREKLENLINLKEVEWLKMMNFISHNCISENSLLIDFLPRNINRMSKIGKLKIKDLGSLFELFKNDKSKFDYLLSRLNWDIFSQKNNYIGKPYSYEEDIWKSYENVRINLDL